MRIGINALYLIPGGVGGTEIYLRSLLGAIAELDDRNEYLVFLNRESAEDPPVRSPRFQLIPCPVRAGNRPLRIVWEQLGLPRLLRKYKAQALLNPGFTMPFLWRGPSITVFHDLQHKRHPEFFQWFDLPFWNLLLWSAARKSTSLIAVSRATANDLERYYPGTAAKTTVVPHGVDAECLHIGERRMGEQRQQPLDVPRPRYLLTISTLHPHKNLDRLLYAFQSFHHSHPEFRLIVAGLRGFAAESLETLRGELRIDEEVTFTGWISRSSLYELLEGADCYIAPSLFEGFGMPILEAMAAGIPSACSKISPLSEIVGPACTQFDPNSIPALRAAMETIAFDPAFRAFASVAGPQRARDFDWKNTALLTLREIEKLA